MADAHKIAAAKKAAQAQVTAQRRRYAVTWALAAVVLVGLFAALIAYIVRQGDVSEVSGDGQLTPTVVSDNGGIGVAKSGVVGEGLDDAPVRLDVYFDFMCPGCGAFEHYEAAVLDELRASGDLVVYYHPLGNLDRYSQGTEFSTRAASAAALVAEESPASFVDFVAGMFAQQPAENTPGLSDEQIMEIARAAGVPDAVVDRIPDHEYSSWVRVATEQAAKDGAAYTPILALDGEMMDLQQDPGAFDWSASETALRDELIRRAEAAS